MKIKISAILLPPGLAYGGANPTLFTFSGEEEIVVTESLLIGVITDDSLMLKVRGVWLHFEDYNSRTKTFIARGRTESTKPKELSRLVKLGWKPNPEAFKYYQLKLP